MKNNKKVQIKNIQGRQNIRHLQEGFAQNQITKRRNFKTFLCNKENNQELINVNEHSNINYYQRAKQQISNIPQTFQSDNLYKKSNKSKMSFNSQANSQPAQNQRQQQFLKLQNLKNRFKRIKTSYDATHQSLKNDLDINQNLTTHVVSGNINNNVNDLLSKLQHIKKGIQKKQSNSISQAQSEQVQEFSITEEDLTFSQSRQNVQNFEQISQNNQSYSFFNNNNRAKQYQNNEKQLKNCFRFTNNNSNSDKQSLNVSQVEINQLNQKAKNYQINNPLYFDSINNNKIHQKYHSLSKQLQNLKHKQLVNLLIQEIQDNQKNKHTIEMQNNQLNKLNTFLKQVDVKNNKLMKEIEQKRNQIQVLLLQQKKNLNCIEKIKNQQSQASLQMVKQDVQLIKQNIKSLKKVDLQNSNAFPSHTSQNYQKKYLQLQSYMNQYINTMSQAAEEYKRKLHQLKSQNFQIKKINSSLLQKLSKIQNQIFILQEKERKMNSVLNNSRNIIRQLEHQFTIVKDENEEIKTISINLKKQLSLYQEKQKVLQFNINHLTNQSEEMIQQNHTLRQELQEIQQKIISNNEVSQEVKQMLMVLNQHKNQLEEKQQSLKQKLKTSLETITQLSAKTSKLQDDIIIQSKNYKSQIQNLRNRYNQIKEKLLALEQQNYVLEQTNTQLQKLQEELLYEYQNQKKQKQLLKKELISIMKQVKQMENVYGKEISTSQKIKQELENFWVNKLNQATVNDQPKAKILSESKSSSKTHQNSNLKNKKSFQQPFTSSTTEPCEISFNKKSQMTKQGSSSLIKNQSRQQRQLQHFESNDNLQQSKSSLRRKQIFPITKKLHNIHNNKENIMMVPSSIEGSKISQKYYSSDQDQQLQQNNYESKQDLIKYILQSSNKQNMLRNSTDTIKAITKTKN